MSVWTEVKIHVAYPKDQNISKIVQEILDNYNYDETFFKSFYSKEKGVTINLSSTHDIVRILPILLEIKKNIKSYSYYEIITFIG